MSAFVGNRPAPPYSASLTVTPAASVTYAADAADGTLPYPLTIVAIPGAGGTLLVEYEVATGGNWQSWPAGAVAVATAYVMTGPVYALRFTAVTASGTVDIAQ